MYQLFEKYFPNVVQLEQKFLQSTWETLYMVFWTALIAGVLGVLLGVVLVSADPSSVLENPPLYNVLEKTIDVCHSIPFIIMLALIQSLTQTLAGTTIGTTTALVPLVIDIIPFFARQIESALLEVDPGAIEAIEAMGTSSLGIIFKIYLIEGLPSIIRVSAMTIINLIGLTATVGAIGTDDLGNLAAIRGYNRLQTGVTSMATLIILIMVLISQAISNQLVEETSH